MNAESKNSRPSTPPTIVTATMAIPVRSRRLQNRPRAAGPRAARNISARTTAATAATTKNPKNTPRTSRMCARSSSLRTGDPVQGDVEVGGSHHEVHAGSGW